MAIRIDGVKVLCDTCEGAYRFSAETSATLVNDQFRVLLPAGWTQNEEDTLICPQCTEMYALAKVDEAQVPDPANDPEPLRQTREGRLAAMKEVVRADLEQREAQFPELREFVRQIVAEDSDMPDFLGHVEDSKIEVRVRGSYVEISWPGEQSMTLTLQHEDLKLVNPPLFMDAKIVEWVQNCLRTMTPDEVREKPESIVH